MDVRFGVIASPAVAYNKWGDFKEIEMKILCCLVFDDGTWAVIATDERWTGIWDSGMDVSDVRDDIHKVGVSDYLATGRCT